MEGRMKMNKEECEQKSREHECFSQGATAWLAPPRRKELMKEAVESL